MKVKDLKQQLADIPDDVNLSIICDGQRLQLDAVRWLGDDTGYEACIVFLDTDHES